MIKRTFTDGEKEEIKIFTNQQFIEHCIEILSDAGYKYEQVD